MLTFEILLLLLAAISLQIPERAKQNLSFSQIATSACYTQCITHLKKKCSRIQLHNIIKQLSSIFFKALLIQIQKIWKLILLFSLTLDMYTHIHTHFAQQSLIFSLFSISVSDINVLLKTKMLISLSMELGVKVLFHRCILSSLNISPSSHLIFFFFKNHTSSWGKFYRDGHIWVKFSRFDLSLKMLYLKHS